MKSAGCNELFELIKAAVNAFTLLDLTRLSRTIASTVTLSAFLHRFSKAITALRKIRRAMDLFKIHSGGV